MNMSYCRFQNTRSDLADCLEAMRDEEELSKDEERAKKAIIEMAKEIAEFE